MKPRTRRWSRTISALGSIRLVSLHLRHGYLISFRLFLIISAVAAFKNLATTPSLIMRTMVACGYRENGYLSIPKENFGMTFPKIGHMYMRSMPTIRRNGNESTFQQNIGNSIAF